MWATCAMNIWCSWRHLGDADRVFWSSVPLGSVLDQLDSFAIRAIDNCANLDTERLDSFPFIAGVQIQLDTIWEGSGCEVQSIYGEAHVHGEVVAAVACPLRITRLEETFLDSGI
jgi:hypothetical protein